MDSLEQVKQAVTEYLQAVRLLATKPQEFFDAGKDLPHWRCELLFALPPALVYCLAMAVSLNSLLSGALYLLIAYLAIGLWMVSLKFVLIVFGENRSFREALHIAAPASTVFLVAAVPTYGPPAAFLLAGLLTVVGLTFYLKMNPGAAVAAVALPVVVSGFAGALLSFLFLGLASMMTIFR